MSTDSISAYEKNARRFLACRDNSSVGIQVTTQWALSLPNNAHVLEIACGGGLPVSRTLINANLRLWAIDSSPTLISIFNNRFPDVPTQCGTIQESDLFQRKYDAAISIGLIFLLTERDQLTMLARVSDILHLGSSFLFTAPIEKGTWADVNTGHTCISLGRDTYEFALGQAGFRIVALHEDIGKNNYYEVEKVIDLRQTLRA